MQRTYKLLCCNTHRQCSAAWNQPNKNKNKNTLTIRVKRAEKWNGKWRRRLQRCKRFLVIGQYNQTVRTDHKPQARKKSTWDQKNKYFKIRTITWETCSHTIHWVFRGILLQLYYSSLKHAYTWVFFMSLIPYPFSFSRASQKLPQRRLTSPQAEENSVFAFLEQEPWLSNFLTMDFIFVLPTYLFCQGN